MHSIVRSRASSPTPNRGRMRVGKVQRLRIEGD
jgi:hypothetical protein